MNRLGIDIFLLGMILIMTMYNFVIFLIRRKDLPLLYFSLFSFFLWRKPG